MNNEYCMKVGDMYVLAPIAGENVTLSHVNGPRTSLSEATYKKMAVRLRKGNVPFKVFTTEVVTKEVEVTVE